MYPLMVRLSLFIGAGALAAGVAGAAEIPPAITDKSPVRVWVDQIGYRADGRKLLIVASDNPFSQPPALELADAATGKAVWKLADHRAAFEGMVRSSDGRAGYAADLRRWWWGSNRLVGNPSSAGSCTAAGSSAKAKGGSARRRDTWLAAPTAVRRNTTTRSTANRGSTTSPT